MKCSIPASVGWRHQVHQCTGVVAALLAVLAGVISLERIAAPGEPPAPATEAVRAAAGVDASVLSDNDWVQSLRTQRFWSGRRSVGGPAAGADLPPGWIIGPDGLPIEAGAPLFGGSYRTVCVRLCDGYYYPISFATSPESFARDEARCQSSCAAPARLFVHQYDVEDGAEAMVDRNGAAYARLKTAFLYRTRYDASCTCKPQPWEQEAQDQHRLYALAADRSRARTAAGKEEIRALRQKLAAAANVPDVAKPGGSAVAAAAARLGVPSWGQPQAASDAEPGEPERLRGSVRVIRIGDPLLAAPAQRPERQQAAPSRSVRSASSGDWKRRFLQPN